MNTEKVIKIGQSQVINLPRGFHLYKFETTIIVIPKRQWLQYFFPRDKIHLQVSFHSSFFSFALFSQTEAITIELHNLKYESWSRSWWWWKYYADQYYCLILCMIMISLPRSYKISKTLFWRPISFNLFIFKMTHGLISSKIFTIIMLKTLGLGR